MYVFVVMGGMVTELSPLLGWRVWFGLVWFGSFRDSSSRSEGGVVVIVMMINEIEC